MKVSEILNPENDIEDMVDIIKLSALPEIDSFIDGVIDLSNNFDVPVEIFNEELRQEFLETAIALKVKVDSKFAPDSRWVKKINNIIKYLSEER